MFPQSDYLYSIRNNSSLFTRTSASHDNNRRGVRAKNFLTNDIMITIYRFFKLVLYLKSLISPVTFTGIKIFNFWNTLLAQSPAHGKGSGPHRTPGKAIALFS